MKDMNLNQDMMVEEALMLQHRMSRLIRTFNKLDEHFNVLFEAMNEVQRKEFNKRFEKILEELLDDM